MSIKTASAGPDIIYYELMNSGIPDFIGGEIFKGSVAFNSTAEDIVIRGRTITTDSNQQQFVDVMAVVPDIQNDSKHWIPNTKRLAEISEMLMPVFFERYEPAYNIQVSECDDMFSLSDGLHCVFYRLLIIIHEPIELNF